MPHVSLLSTVCDLCFMGETPHAAMRSEALPLSSPRDTITVDRVVVVAWCWWTDALLDRFNFWLQTIIIRTNTQ